MDGILKPFERCLQLRNPRLERLNAVLPIDLWRRAAGALPTASQQSTHALRDRDAGRLCRLGAWRLLGFGLSLHSSAPPDPLLGCRAKGRDRNQTGESRLAPRVSIICLKLRTWARRASVALGPSAEVLRAGSVPNQRYSVTGTHTTAVAGGHRP